METKEGKFSYIDTLIAVTIAGMAKVRAEEKEAEKTTLNVKTPKDPKLEALNTIFSDGNVFNCHTEKVRALVEVLTGYKLTPAEPNNLKLHQCFRTESGMLGVVLNEKQQYGYFGKNNIKRYMFDGKTYPVTDEEYNKIVDSFNDKESFLTFLNNTVGWNVFNS